MLMAVGMSVFLTTTVGADEAVGASVVGDHG